MIPLFRLANAIRHDRRVDAWFADGDDDLRRLVRPWFERIRGCGTDVRELLHDGRPTACVDDAAFAYVDAFAVHASVGFFHGAALADPAGLLEGSGKRMRHVKLRYGGSVEDASLQRLIESAYDDIRQRLTGHEEERA
ncbi:DUF1801 domain-containing protein [Sphingosinicella sp. BN140058]|uniref:DUF1801 domain-containing protein n=1 Tax=Sphingosinicella sp. BN140058 TaxID=1892855 RepID=UPI00101098CD|nr:DUF1801 domain-containing protein [Sphingosinicella sp. BN140058]QAY75423.1 DUF1801 domain-containing protein [Sphingosinicella sp. BN140058]